MLPCYLHVVVHLLLSTCCCSPVVVYLLLFTCCYLHVVIYMLFTCCCLHVVFHLLLFTCCCSPVVVYVLLFTCCLQLHTKDTWLKEGRLVRLQEKAYRVVKARPKRVSPPLLPSTILYMGVLLQGQSSAEAVHNTVEVYGRWQTEEYMPPLVIEVRIL